MPEESQSPRNARAGAIIAFRQTPEHRAALDVLETASRPGRYHDRGDPSPVYASSTPQAAMAELARHAERGALVFATDDVRRLSTLELPSAPILDLVDPAIREAEEITYQQLVGDDLGATRALARRVRERGDVVGLRAPSAAVEGAITYVIFHEHLQQLILRTEEIVTIRGYVESGASAAQEESPGTRPLDSPQAATVAAHEQDEMGHARQIRFPPGSRYTLTSKAM
jgi:hypothetical protein